MSRAPAITLVELLVVLGIIGVVVGMSIPALTGYGKRLRLKSMTRQVVGMLSLARSMAISTRDNHAVVVDEEEGTITIRNEASEELLEKLVRIPSSVTVEMTVGGEPDTNMQIVFRSSGALSGRTTILELSDREKRHTISVTGATGAVSLTSAAQE